MSKIFGIVNITTDSFSQKMMKLHIFGILEVCIHHQGVNGYLVTKELEDLDSYIVLSSLNDNQGIMGALKLAVDELAMQ